jgi:hypothetical protein
LFSFITVSLVSAGRATACLPSTLKEPDIRAPRWKVTKHQPNLINPGYWFVAPYSTWEPTPERLEYQPFQVGPHIYDGDGVSSSEQSETELLSYTASCTTESRLEWGSLGAKPKHVRFPHVRGQRDDLLVVRLVE